MVGEHGPAEGHSRCKGPEAGISSGFSGNRRAAGEAYGVNRGQESSEMKLGTQISFQVKWEAWSSK